VSIINENIAYAKSILNKNGINTDSPEYQDYLKIREICGNSNGYVGILTRIRFVDQIEDMDEISSIFDILKNSKINVNKLTRMSYAKILDLFYNELGEDKDKDKDVELVYKDSQYSYFKVHTYKGILRIGSPTWCLKTKSHWDNYHRKYPDQWVVIDNRYVKSIITPDNNYLDNYKSSKGWIRFGVSINMDMLKGEESAYVAFSDNNYNTRHNRNHTFFGILFTILNLSKGIKKSYYQKMAGCEPVEGSKTWLKVIDRPKVYNNFNLPDKHFRDEEEVYIYCSKSYSSHCGFLLLTPTLVKTFYPARNSKKLNFSNLTGAVSKGILEKYAMNNDDNLFSGVHLKKGKLTLEEIQSKDQYLGKVDKWLIFDRNSDFYQVVNTDVNSYEVPVYTLNQKCFEMGNPMYFYVNKETYKVYNTDTVDSDEYALDVIEFLKELNKPEVIEEPDVIEEPKKEPKKKVGGFWNFIKGK